MDVVIQPEWSFLQAFLVALHAYPGDNIGVKGYRNWVLKAWASTVGRERACRSIAEYRAIFPSKREAAAAMGISVETFRRLEEHFDKVREVERPGLTLGFDTRLHRFDPTAFDALIAQVLGPDTDVTIVERSPCGVDGPGFMRIHGADPEDLVRVAEAFYQRAWRSAQEVAQEGALSEAVSRGFGTLLGRLEKQRDCLVSIREELGILRQPDVVEMLEDQGAAHVLAKDKKSLQTRVQRLGASVAKEAGRRALGQIGDVLQDDVAELLPFVGGD